MQMMTRSAKTSNDKMKGRRVKKTTKSVNTKFSKSTINAEEETQIVDSTSDFRNEENESNLTMTLKIQELPSAKHNGHKRGSKIAPTPNASNPKSIGSRKRGRSRGVKLVGEPMFLEFDSLNNPIGEWAHKYGVYIGTCAYRIDINVGSYFDVSDVEKNHTWEEAKRLFNIEEPDLDKKEYKFHSLVAARFRNWKTKLRRRWLMNNGAICDEHDEQSTHEEQYEEWGSEDEGIKLKQKKKDVPWVVYAGLISKEQWKDFEKRYYSDEFQAISQKARASGKNNDHPHRMGQNSYYVSEEKWIKEGRLSPPPAIEDSDSDSGSGSTPYIAHRVSRRPKVWKLAHEKKLLDGSWGIDPEDNKTKEVVEKIDQHLEAEAKAKAEGTFVEEYGMDVLSKALGKRDHCGRVRAMGGLNLGQEKVFGKSNRKDRKPRITGELTQQLEEKFLEMKEKLEKEFDARVAAAVEEALKKRFGNGSLSKENTCAPDTSNDEAVIS